VKRGLAHTETSSKRHASPLANSGLTQDQKTNNNAQMPSNVFSNPTAVASNETKAKQGSNVFGSNVFESSSTQSSQLQTENEGLKRPFKESQRVFGSKASPSKSQGNVFGRHDLKANISQNKTPFSSVSAKSHVSPLAGLRNSPTKAGGSILSGLSSQANTESNNIASIVQKYEQTSSQPSFQASSGNVFSSTVLPTSQGLQSADQVASVGSGFGGSSIASTTAPPNVNLFAMAKTGITNTVTSNTPVQKVSGGTALFSGYMANKVLNTDNKSGVNPNHPGSANPSLPGSTNVVGLTNPLCSANPFGSTNPNPITPTNPVQHNSSPKKIGVFSNTAPSQRGNSPSTFGSMSSTTPNTNLQNINTNVFGRADTSTTQPSGLFTTKQTLNSPTLNPKPFGDTGGVFGATSLLQKPTNKPFSDNSLASQNIAVEPNKGSVFGNAGLPVSSASTTKGPFTSNSSGSGNNQSLVKTGQSFASVGLLQTPATSSNTSGPFTSRSLGDSGSATKTGSVFGSAGLGSNPTGKGGVFTQKQGPFSSGKNVTPVFAQTPRPAGGVFGSAVTSAGQQRTAGVFSTPNSGLVQAANTGSIFGSAAQASTFSPGGVFSGQNNATLPSQTQDLQVGRVSSSEKHKGLL
jgi:hypothetical protein